MVAGKPVGPVGLRLGNQRRHRIGRCHPGRGDRLKPGEATRIGSLVRRP